MSVVLMNTVNLDDGRIINKGGSGGGGVTIKNQTKSVTIAENGNTVVSYDSGYTGLEKVSVKVAIPNEEKVVDITENGTTEVVADNGFLSKVIVNTNVTSGGGGGSDIPVIGDGKTYLYIMIAEKGRMTVPLYFSQTVANGVTIDWGDGSATQTLSGTGKVSTTHTYADVGEYVISLNPADGCTLGLGHKSSYYCVMGSTEDTGKVYCNMLQAVEIGKNVTIIEYAFPYCYSLASVVIPNSVTSIGNSAFNACYSLINIVIPNSVTSIGDYAFSSCCSLVSVVIPNNVTRIGSGAFDSCYSLTSVMIPNSVTSISSSAFSNCRSLTSIVIPDGVKYISNSVFRYCYSLVSAVIPNSVTSIESNAFNSCYGIAYCDFRAAKSVPTLSNTNAFSTNSTDCKIVVPDALYDEWKAATNWSFYASKIVKASKFNA